EFWYVERGQGTPVVFVHGSLGDYRTWGRQMEPFSQRYRVIAYSRRYHYPNRWSGDGRDYSPSLHAGDLTAILAKLTGREPAHLVGASYGAAIALTMALNQPEAVR